MSPRVLAQKLNESQTYMAKITGWLVKAGILRAHRGVAGGVTLNKSADTITLLEIVEACQGKILANYCQEFPKIELVCAFHKAMAEIHQATTDVLKRWTLADLAAKPCPSMETSETVLCRMTGITECGG